MNKRIITTLHLLILLGLSPVWSEETPLLPPPTEPVLATLPGLAAWNEIYAPKKTSSPAENSAASPKETSLSLKKVQAEKGASNLHLTRIWSDDSRTEYWQIKDTSFEERPGSSSVYVTTPERRASSYSDLDYTKSPFPELNWVSLKSYVGVALYAGKPCYIFRETSKSTPPITKIAWIDGATKLPVAYDDGNSVRTFEFVKAPSSEPQPSERFQSEINNYENAIRATIPVKK